MEAFEIFLSITTTLLAIIALQGKSMTFILVFQLLLNVLVVLQYVISDNPSAALICTLAVVQVIIIYLFQRKKRVFPIWLTAIFMIGYTAISILQYTAVYDLITALAAWMFALSVVQRSPAVSRLFSFFNGALWIAFDLFATAYSSLPVHITILTIAVVSIVRLDRCFWREFFQGKRRKSKKTPFTS